MSALALDPTEHSGQVEDHEKHQEGFDRDDADINDHDGSAPPLPN
jgi:hypothetical protein